MATVDDVQYVSGADGKVTAVIVPIGLWREISSERETAYLLRSETMKRRLLEAKGRRDGISRDEVREKLGI
jgi:PHD/YefM family antitoxin component YafN of YafNO toxin-antitoxin module